MFKKIYLFIFMGLLSSLGLANATEPLTVGAPAPHLTGLDQDGQKVELVSFYKKGLTLVYFYPKASTPGCTAEACSLRDAFADLQAKGIQIVGVSADSPDSQKKFHEKYKLPFTLLSDPEGKIMKAFGVSTFFGFASRQSFLIKDDKVVWRDTKASTSQQAADVLNAVGRLK